MDHPEGISVGTTFDGEIIGYEEIISPISCMDNHGNKVLELVENMDDGFFIGEDGDWLVVDFGEIDWKRKAVIVGVVPPTGYAVHVQVEIDNEWEDAGVIYPRAKSSTQLVDLSSYDFEGKLRLYCEGNAKIDYVALVEPETEGIKIRECPLVSATHSANGSVKHELLIVDEDYVELVPGDIIALTFAAVGKYAHRLRDFVLVSTGYYVGCDPEGTQTAGEGATPLTTTFSIIPNPSTSFEIGYTIPNNDRVTLNIYDVSGRIVRTLVNNHVGAGYYRISWDGRDTHGKSLSSGIYFAKIYTSEFKDIKKLVLIK